MSEPVREDEDPRATPLHKPDIDILLPGIPVLAARGFVYLLVLTMVATFLWAAWARVDVVAESKGAVIPEGEAVRIDAPVAGMISGLMVEVGQHVEKGDMLCQLDPLEATSRAERAAQELMTQTRELERTRAGIRAVREILDKGPTPERIAAIPIYDVAQAAAEMARAGTNLDELNSLTVDSAAVRGGFTAEEMALRLQAKGHEIEGLRSSITAATSELNRITRGMEDARVVAAQAAEALRAARASREGAEHVFGIIQREEATYRVLTDSGMVSEIEYLSRKRDLERQRYDVERFRAAEAQAEKEIERQELLVKSAGDAMEASRANRGRLQQDLERLQAEQNLIGAEGRRRVTSAGRNFETARAVVQQALTRFAADEQALLPRIEATRVTIMEATEIAARTSILAPIAGTIAYVEAKNPMQYVQPSQPFILLIPDTAPLVAEVRVSNRDVALIKPGATCRLKLEAFPFQDYGVFTGRVISVSPDILPESSDYRVLASFDRTTVETREGLQTIRPGMQFIAEIKVREKTILEFLFEPFFKLARGGAVVAE